jgi:hypothetical protein
MIYLVVLSELVDATAERLHVHYPELAERIRLIEYSQFVTRTLWPLGTYLFTSVAELGELRKSILHPIEQALSSSGCTLLNRPSQVPTRRAHLKISAIDQVQTFPVVIRCDLLTGSLESRPIANAQELQNQLELMTMDGIDLEIGYALPMIDPKSSHAAIHLGAQTQLGYHAARFEWRDQDGRQVLWRVDDGPLAIFPPDSPSRSELILAYLELDRTLTGEVRINLEDLRLADLFPTAV